jgi:hypothetical protein
LALSNADRPGEILSYLEEYRATTPPVVAAPLTESPLAVLFSEVTATQIIERDALNRALETVAREREDTAVENRRQLLESLSEDPNVRISLSPEDEREVRRESREEFEIELRREQRRENDIREADERALERFERGEGLPICPYALSDEPRLFDVFDEDARRLINLQEQERRRVGEDTLQRALRFVPFIGAVINYAYERASLPETVRSITTDAAVLMLPVTFGGTTATTATRGVERAAVAVSPAPRRIVFAPRPAPVEPAVVQQQIRWGTWKDLPKTCHNGREYAKIGEYYYSRHAVDYMIPKNLRIKLKIPDRTELRGIPPMAVEETIKHGAKNMVTDSFGKEALEHSLGNIKVYTDKLDPTIVITVRKGK